jgi:hypothetical protein
VGHRDIEAHAANGGKPSHRYAKPLRLYARRQIDCIDALLPKGSVLEYRAERVLNRISNQEQETRSRRDFGLQLDLT